MKLLMMVAMFVALGGSAVAQSRCGVHASMVMRLDAQYGESRRGVGLSGPGSAFEIWASEATGTWTILKVYPSGMACLMASGESWRTEQPKPRGEPT